MGVESCPEKNIEAGSVREAFGVARGFRFDEARDAYILGVEELGPKEDGHRLAIFSFFYDSGVFIGTFDARTGIRVPGVKHSNVPVEGPGAPPPGDTPVLRRLSRPYFLLEGISEVPESAYTGMKVGLPPICICCRRATDGPASGCAEALCFECYELVRTRGSSLRTTATQSITPGGGLSPSKHNE